MNARAGRIAVLLLVTAIPSWASHARHPTPTEFSCPVAVRFSPHGGAEDAVASTLRQARSRVRAAIYGLTSPAIEAALEDRALAGVHVALKIDRGQSAGPVQSALLSRLRGVGVAVEVSPRHFVLHDKFAIVDDRWVVTGSFNWTTSAERRNRENILIFDCPALARHFDAEWESIASVRP